MNASDPKFKELWDKATQIFLRSLDLGAHGQHEEALACAEQGIAFAPWFPMLRLAKSIALIGSRSRYGDALKCCDECIELSQAMGHVPPQAYEKRAEALLYMAATTQDQTHVPVFAGEALNAANEGLALAPGDVPLMHKKAWALTTLGRHEDALRCADEALATDPNNRNMWNGRAHNLRALGRDNEAEASLEKARLLS